MENTAKRLRGALLGGVLATAAASTVWSCAGGSAYGGVNPYNPGGNNNGGGGHPSNCAAHVAPAGTEVIGVDLSASSCDDSTYGAVLGFFGGDASTSSQVVSITHSSGDVVEFTNVDDANMHTAADLGTWSGSFPGTGPNPNATPSPAGTDISAPGFTAGVLNPGQTSAAYVADVPGVYTFGCAIHYSIGMRTVVIVQ